MKNIISRFVTQDGEVTALTLKIAYVLVGMIIGASIILTYNTFNTEQVYQFGIYG